MSLRGLVIALLCGLLGLAGGAALAWVGEGTPSASGRPAVPLAAQSPSVPIDVITKKPYRRDIDYPTLSPDLSLPAVHAMKNKLAHWTYHVPQGWPAYAVCGSGSPCQPPTVNDDLIRPKRIDKAPQARFRPPDEPLIGGYSLRVRILDNQIGVNPEQMVATKRVGFAQSFTDFHVIKRTSSSIYFEYRDEPSNYHRFNYFQWFAVAGSPTATLEMSVSGRAGDVPGLEALFNRFADNVMAQ